MNIRRVTSSSVAEAEPGLWSNCLVVGDIAYFSGLTARGADGITINGKDEYEQTKVIFEKFKALIEAAGGAMADIVKMTVFVTRIDHRQQVWKARREFFTGDFPTSALVEVFRLAAPEIFVEIEGIAHLGAGKR